MITYKNANKKERSSFIDLFEMKERIRKVQSDIIKSGTYRKWLIQSKTAIHVGSNIREHLNPDKIDDVDFHTEIEFNLFLKDCEK